MKSFIVFIICLSVLFVTTRFTRPELFSDENKFQTHLVRNGTIIAQLQNFKWYEEEYSDSYYLFTDKGVLKIHSGGNSSDDEDLSDMLEEHRGMFCSLNVQDQVFGHWIITSFNNCQENNYSIQKRTSSNSDVPESDHIIYNEIPESQESKNSDVPN